MWSAQPEVERVAVADSTPLLEKARSRFLRAYEEWQTMLEVEKPEIVIACADNRTSARMAIAAMEAGANVMGKKPMAADLADAQAMETTAQYT